MVGPSKESAPILSVCSAPSKEPSILTFLSKSARCKTRLVLCFVPPGCLRLAGKRLVRVLDSAWGRASHGRPPRYLVKAPTFRQGTPTATVAVDLPALRMWTQVAVAVLQPRLLLGGSLLATQDSLLRLRRTGQALPGGIR